jgi:hypothetical protein
MVPLKRIGIQDQYYYTYGGRENIQKVCGLDREQVLGAILEWKNGAGDAQPRWSLGPKRSLTRDAGHV